MRDFDLIVLGGGNSMDVVRGCGEAGLSVALVEEGPLGGTCPNRGCIPSKLVLAHADVAEGVRGAARFHVEARLGSIDADRILKETADYVSGFDGQLEEALPDAVTLFRGRGAFVGERTVEVGGERLRGRHVVIATGSRPRRPDFDGPWWTSDDVFRLDRAPSSLTLVGGGFIACELAHFFHGVGVETRMLVRDDVLLPAEDAEVRRAFQEAFVARVPVSFGAEVASLEHDGARFRGGLEGGGHFESEAVLFAIGRVPNSDGIGLETTGLEPNARGFIDVDDHLRTGVDGIHAMGDVAGRHMFTHAASWEAKYLARRILAKTDAPPDYVPLPHAVFTDPEVAGAGETEEALKKAGKPYVKGTFPFKSATKGRAIKEEHGLAKLLLDPDGAILGCHIVGAHASILLHEVLPVMKWRNHVSSLTGIIHVHPSLPEVIRGVARKAEAALAG